MNAEQSARLAFLEEAQELLVELESGLLELEQSPTDPDLISRVFRALHTIKGSGAMFGFEEIASFTHDVESAFDMVREGTIVVSKELLDLTLQARDHIQVLLNDPDQAQEENGAAILKGVRALLPAAVETGSAGGKQESPGNDPGQRHVFRIRFVPEPAIFSSGTNPLHLVDELAELGTASVVTNLDDVPPLEGMEPEHCQAAFDIILDTETDENGIRDVFIFVEDSCELDIRLLDEGKDDTEDTYKRLGEILVDRGDISRDDLDRILSSQKPIGKLLQEAGLVSRTRVDAALAEQSAVRQSRKSRQGKAQAEAASIRVAADKLDSLVNLVGELVIIQARISQVAGENDDPVMSGLAEELERLSSELRDSTLNIRMIPIGTTFSRFRRLVRDLSSELGKEIQLVTHGAETELDKTVIEKLADPLVHLLRNSIDHGIETPDLRVEQGKQAQGTITLAAEHAGGEVVIQIMDDGAGLDPETIFSKAVEKGIVSPATEMEREEIFALIFQPGFSTAQTVSNVSGRGVGMDVVKRSIEALRGTIDIRSEKWSGTTITIKLPLTLAIIEGLQVQVGEEFFVLPLSIVEECMELSREKNGQKLVEVRGELVPYIRLRDWFSINGNTPPIEQVVITGRDGERVGIVVDTVIGEHQTVIKSLGKLYKNIEGLSGATIKGDGTMALILDVPALSRSVLQERRK